MSLSISTCLGISRHLTPKYADIKKIVIAQKIYYKVSILELYLVKVERQRN